MYLLVVSENDVDVVVLQVTELVVYLLDVSENDVDVVVLQVSELVVYLLVVSENDWMSWFYRSVS